MPAADILRVDTQWVDTQWVDTQWRATLVGVMVPDTAWDEVGEGF